MTKLRRKLKSQYFKLFLALDTKDKKSGNLEISKSFA
jgi:hypothetical protein